MSLLNNTIGNVGSNPSNMTPKKRPAFTNGQASSFQATAGSTSSTAVSSNLSYTATGQILVDKGQIIRGEVTDIRNNTVSVKVDLGETITYPLQGDPELTIGQTATFKAVETEDGIALRAISARPSQARLATINKALEEAGLQKSERNQTIVLELLNNQMSIDKQSIQKIFQQSLLNKNASISTLVLMNKYDFPITDATSTQFENYRNFDHQLSKDIGVLADQIPKMLDKVSTFTNFNTFMAVHDGVMNILIDDTAIPQETPLYSVLSGQKEQMMLLDLLRPFALTNTLEQSIHQQTASLREVVTCIQDSIAMAEQMEKEQSAALENPVIAEETGQTVLTNDGTGNTNSNKLSLTDVFQAPIVRHVLDQFTTQQFNNNELSTFLSLQNRQTLSLSLAPFPLSEKVRNSIINGQIGTNELLRAIQNAMKDTNPVDAKSLYSSQVFQWVLKEHTKSTMSLSPQDIASGNVNQFYDNTYQQINSIRSFLENTGLKEAFQEMHNTASNLQENMEFMRVINQLFPYVQLPIKLKEQYVHSDLYVYTKKKNLREHPENISVLLHLDMENLGATDIHVTLARSSVQAKFYLSDDFSTELLKNNIDLLEDGLARNGYLFHAEFFQREKNVDIVKDIIEKDQPATSLKRFSFDIRA
ncbi:flagellar hook-length control protein FliK [Anaerosporobacter faecicola]|uniref:flagellar hook-length control protein FliK n=1 Tax=Anaerosporobacter faecicola TaxID=2718714 RepID=UPI00143C3308|nr:flagellar hook-length control protein FliK [Anaerosporobacter faecicola]